MRHGTCPRCTGAVAIEASDVKLFGKLQCPSCHAFLEIVDPFRLEIRTCGRSGTSWLCDWIHCGQDCSTTITNQRRPSRKEP